MRNSQQEIAAPKLCCNRYYKNVAIAASTVSITILLTLLLFIFAKNAYGFQFVLSIALCILFALVLVASIILLIKSRLAYYLATVIGFALLSAGFALILQIVKNNDILLVSSLTLTLSMLLALIFLGIIVTFGVYLIIKNKERTNIYTVLLSVLFSPTVFFTALFYKDFEYTSSDYSFKFLLGYTIISSFAQVLLCLIFSLATVEKKVIKTKWLTYCATFAALSVVCKIMGNAISFIPSLRFTLVYIPWVIGGVVLSPFGGALSAAIGDVLGQLIMPAGIGALNPFITLGNTLFAFIPALLYKYSPKNKKFLFLSFGIILSTLVCTLGINSLAIYQYFKNSMGYWDYFVLKRLPQTIVIAINHVLILLLIPALERTKTINLRFLAATPTK